MVNKSKKYMLTFFICMSFLLVACGKEDVERESSQIEQLEEFYEEIECQLPEGVKDVADISVMQDGTWLVIGMSDNWSEGTLWTSTDEGNTWEKGESITDELPKEKIKEGGSTEYFSTLSATGEVFVRAYYYERGLGSYEVGYYLISESRVTELPIVLQASENGMENGISKAMFAKDGRLLVSDLQGSVLQIDKEDGTIVHIYENEDYVIDFTTAENVIYLYGYDGVRSYDIETGEPKELLDALKPVEKVRKNAAGDSEELNFKFAIAAKEDEAKGYAFDGRNIRKITDGKEGIVAETISLSHKEYYNIIQFIVEKDTVLLLGWEESGTRLWKYKQSERTEITDEINIYALRENRSLRQWISLYEKQNPQVKVNLEIGMENTELSKSDAITLLNTKILAGEGADIFYLDGLNVENLISKGVLLDFSESLNTLHEEYEMLESVMNTYQEGEAVYALPLNFEFITAVGTREEASAARNMESYASRVKAGQKMNLPAYEWGMILASYYQTDFMTKLARGESVEESIRTFYEQLEIIYHAQTDKEIAREAIMGTELYPEEPNQTIQMLLQGERNNLTLDYIASTKDLQTLIVIKNNSELIEVTLGEGENKYFVPRNIIGMNAQSKKLDIVEDFMRFAVENSGQNDRFSVSQNILKEQLKQTLAGVWYIENEKFEMEVLSQSDQETYLKLFQELNIPASTNEELFKILLVQGARFLGESPTTLEEAVKVANDRMELYFSE